ncbi:MAG: hypothetical protein SFW67_32190 [Myxococcaceae bacterium]|nr:hypothetical protein [Myxococcaceae bacterium]
MRVALMVGVVLSGCGLSEVDLREDPREGGGVARATAGFERSTDERVLVDAGGPPSDAGPEATVDAGREPEPLVDAGTPAPVPDAGAPEPTPDAGAPNPEVPRDAGPPPECEGVTSRPCTTTCGSSSTQRCEQGRWGRCEVPREVCGDGVDNDCDGRIDGRDFDCPPPVRRCEDVEGGGCNGDLGYGNRCAPSDNTGGCSPSRFHAWCNRRNPAYPNVWDTWIRTWVDARCDGTLSETGGQYSTWVCTSSDNERFECTTPLVVSRDGAPVRFERSAARFAFTPGRPVLTDWPSSETPWLCRDVNGNGRIDDGSELFGSDTRVAGGTARHGFEALAALDANRDGVIDVKDPAFAELRLWSDLDGDRRSTPEELTTLEAAGLRTLSLGFSVTPRCDGRGNCERERATATWREGHVGSVVDVYLRHQRAPRHLASMSCSGR